MSVRPVENYDVEIPTRAEADEARRRASDSQIRVLREKVAKALLSSAGRSGTFVTVNGANDVAVQAILEELRTKGWSAEFRSDQRDGDYLSIR